MHTKKPTITPTPQPGFVELRGKSGRLYGYYDPHRQVIEVKRGDVKDVAPCRLSAEARGLGTELFSPANSDALSIACA